MPRRPRIQFPGAIYHVMSRGNRKNEIFDDDDDRRRFLTVLSQAVHRYMVKCLDFCLMSNHYHLVLETPRGNLSQAMRHINGVYAQASNRRHHRTGHVFEGRFRSIVIEPATYLRRTARYVALNPVRARYVGDVDAYPWSSYRATAGLGAAPPFLHVEWTRSAFGGKSLGESQERYRAYVSKESSRLAEFDLEALAFGRPEFVEAVREVSSMKHRELVLPLFSRVLVRPALPELFATVDGCRSVRNNVVYEAHVSHGYPLSEIARFLRVHPSTCSVIFRRLHAERQLEKSA